MRLPIFCLVLCTPLLTGCGAGLPASPAASTETALGIIAGQLHGGQSPVVGAQVYLYAAGSSGYGGSGIAASATNASVSLLASPGYVTTDATGSFSITGDYTCTAGQQVYIVALGGQPVPSVTNPMIGEMAVLGQCPASGTLAQQVPYLVISEVTTVAAAYALAGFATDVTHIGSSGTPLALTGIANAFANASQLANIATGTALLRTPVGGGYVPQTEINSIANILAACVNSDGTVTACATLQADDASGGGTSGQAPGDTATAAIYLAQNPGTAYTTTLFNLAGGSGAPFQPSLSSPPNDFAMPITFTGENGCTYIGVTGLAIDASGNAWVANTGQQNASCDADDSITKFSPLGAANHYYGGGYLEPVGLAVDRSSNVWVTNVDNRVYQFNDAGTQLQGNIEGDILNDDLLGIAIDATGNGWVSSGPPWDLIKLPPSFGSTSAKSYNGGGFKGAYNVAVDGSNNVWTLSGALIKFSNAGVPFSASGYSGGLSGPTGLAIDNVGNVWITNTGNNTLSEFSNTGQLISSTAYSGGGLSTPNSVCIDGAGTAWVANSGASAISHFSSTGVALSPSSGYKGAAVGNVLYYPNTVAVDGSGDVWVVNGKAPGNVLGGGVYARSVTEMIGMAAPVITPIVAGLPTTPTTDGSSSLGTRP